MRVGYFNLNFIDNFLEFVGLKVGEVIFWYCEYYFIDGCYVLEVVFSFFFYCWDFLRDRDCGEMVYCFLNWVIYEDYFYVLKVWIFVFWDVDLVDLMLS